MKSIPQNVSRRYVRNLVADGRNSCFELESINQQVASTPGGLPCGVYYTAEIKSYPAFDCKKAEGATPEAAVTRALEAFGVTFR